MQLFQESFGLMPDRREVFLFTLERKDGIVVQVTNFGAKLVRIQTPDKHGKLGDVVLGYSCLDHYLNGMKYLGATIGRVAGRISNARFKLNRQTYFLDPNHPPHHLHGGSKGFESLLWEIHSITEKPFPQVEFRLCSPNGDQGYPSNLEILVSYSLKSPDCLSISFKAKTDQPTPVNLTNHAYFNLRGDDVPDIFGHQLRMPASRYLETDEDSLPTGRLVTVENSVLDFRKPSLIGDGINADFEPVKRCGGYDQYWVLDDSSFRLKLQAEVWEPESGRVMEVFSTLPGLQFYTANGFSSVFPLRSGKISGHQSSFCIEPQLFPDAPNRPEFPSVILNSGEVYDQTIEYRFSLKDNK